MPLTCPVLSTEFAGLTGISRGWSVQFDYHLTITHFMWHCEKTSGTVTFGGRGLGPSIIPSRLTFGQLLLPRLPLSFLAIRRLSKVMMNSPILARQLRRNVCSRWSIFAHYLESLGQTFNPRLCPYRRWQSPTSGNRHYRFHPTRARGGVDGWTVLVLHWFLKPPTPTPTPSQPYEKLLGLCTNPLSRSIPNSRHNCISDSCANHTKVELLWYII